ncbi:hypothetical protein TNCV_634551 [Trichonephila clavipes]|nr:hypothetical protein TNCV_634551 [Trichonephila clavipes]
MGGVVGFVLPSMRVGARPKSMDFHDANKLSVSMSYDYAADAERGAFVSPAISDAALPYERMRLCAMTFDPHTFRRRDLLHFTLPDDRPT